jgi:hypothetical protein
MTPNLTGVEHADFYSYNSQYVPIVIIITALDN